MLRDAGPTPVQKETPLAPPTPLSRPTMYEGKNIHYSPDNKPLCSYSTKKCRKRRLNGYAFCVQHILEDPSSPFKACQYEGRGKPHCCNPIPKDHARSYCNTHMTLLGLATRPNKDNKAGVKVANADAKMTLEDRLKRYNSKKISGMLKAAGDQVNKGTQPGLLRQEIAHNPDDPYAFPDPTQEKKSRVPPPSISKPAPSSVTTDLLKFAKTQALTTRELLALAKNPPLTGGGHLTASQALTMLKTAQQVNLNVTVQKDAQPPVSGAAVKLGSGIAGCVNTTCSSVTNAGTPVVTNSMSVSTTMSSMSSVPMAKLYPELAEKLGLDRPPPPPPPHAAKPAGKAESKLSSRSSAKSSRTMNRLQTKIAQNKLKQKDKSKKIGSQNSISDSSQPATPVGPPQQSPSVMFLLDIDANQVAVTYGSIVTPTAVTCQSAPVAMVAQPFLFPPRNNHGNPLQQQPHTASIQTTTVTSFPQPLMSSPHMHNLHPFPSNTSSQPPQKQQQTLTPKIEPFAPSLAEPAVSQPASVQSKPPQPYVHTPPSPFRLAPPLSSKASLCPYPNSSQINNVPSISLKSSKTVSVPTTTSVSQISTVPIASSSNYSSSFQLACCRPHPMIEPGTAHQVQPRLIKRRTALKVYTQMAQQKATNTHLLPSGFESSSDSDISEDELPWQRHWLSMSSDEESDKEEDDMCTMARTIRLCLLRSRLRRQCMQLRKSLRANRKLRHTQQEHLSTLKTATRVDPEAALAAVKVSREEPTQHQCSRRKDTLLESRPCLNQMEENAKCDVVALPYTNHCLKHIMYNIDQQLFDYCTAKFADNTQCCVPVFDIRHELPLCAEHAAKADNYNKSLEYQKPKKPRKKTKPSALTRPPKKGKKKKVPTATLR